MDHDGGGGEPLARGVGVCPGARLLPGRCPHQGQRGVAAEPEPLREMQVEHPGEADDTGEPADPALRGRPRHEVAPRGVADRDDRTRQRRVAQHRT